MDDVTIARALHVLAVLHWIGGVSLVTLVLLPGITRSIATEDRLELFEMIEGRFAFQARISTVVAGATGFYMIYQMDGWERFADPVYWWMHAMVAVWAIFTFILFIAEPLVLHRWFHERAKVMPEETFALALTMHRILLAASAVTLVASVLGAHGAI
jgi:uncharacterized membrane protein